MKKNIYAFLIPLITLLVIAFTPIFDGVLGDFKYKINLEGEKIFKSISNRVESKLSLEKSMIDNKDRYRKIINKNFKDESNQIAAMNYIYYLNKRNIALVAEEKSITDESVIKEVLKYDFLMRLEFQKILDSKVEIPIKLIKVYKETSEVNNNISIVAYTISDKYYDEYKVVDYMGEDANATAGDTLLY